MPNEIGDRVPIIRASNLLGWGIITRRLPDGFVEIEDTLGSRWKAEATILYTLTERLPRSPQPTNPSLGLAQGGIE
jgi:hypothetical protein